MSLASRCSFCAKLLAVRDTSLGRSGKCPLCKGDLVIARGSGVTCRLAAPEESVPRPCGGQGLLLAACGVVVVVGAAVTAQALLGLSSPAENE